MRIEKDFVAHFVLGAHDITRLAHDPQIVVGVRPDLRIAYVNDAWDTFARNNGGLDVDRWSLGTDLMSVVPANLRRFYAGLLERIRKTGEPVGHLYECSSPTTLRRFHMQIYPLLHDAFLFTHALVEEEPHPGPVQQASPSLYEDDGVVTMCVHCRKTQRPGTEQWDWVADYVAHPPAKRIDGMCPVCFSYLSAAVTSTRAIEVRLGEAIRIVSRSGAPESRELKMCPEMSLGSPELPRIPSPPG
jgi:hypothetical protein